MTDDTARKSWSFFTNPFTTLNWTRKPGTYLYNENAMKQLSPHVREELLRGYYNGLGLTETDVFHSALNTYFTEQDKAFERILEKYKDTLTEDDKKELKAQLKAMQEPVRKSALAFDKTLPGKAPTAVHPRELENPVQRERDALLKDLGDFNLDGLLGDLKSRVDSAEPPKPVAPSSTTSAPDAKKPEPRVKPIHAQAIRNFLSDVDSTESEVQRTLRLMNLQDIILLEEQLQEETDKSSPNDGRVATLKLQIEDKTNLVLVALEEIFNKDYRPTLRIQLREALKKEGKSDSELEFYNLLQQRTQAAIDEKLTTQKEKIKTQLALHRASHPGGHLDIGALVRAAHIEMAEEETAPKTKPKKSGGFVPRPESFGMGTGDAYKEDDEEEEDDESDFYDTDSGLEDEEDSDKPIRPVIDLEALKKEFQDAQEDAKKKLEEDFTKTITALHKAAQRERELIGWLASVECARRRATTSSDPGYTVTMTAVDQNRVKQLHTAIQEKDDAALNALGLYSPSGLPIQVGKDDKGQLTFSITFPSAFWGGAYYSDPKHNSYADLLFQASLVRGTGAKTIVTNINHDNEIIAKQLAREAFEAAREVGYSYSDKAEDNQITIQINGTTISRKELFTERLEDIQHPGQQIPEVDLSGVAEMKASNAMQAEKAVQSLDGPEAQRRLSELLRQGREEAGLAEREMPKGSRPKMGG